MPTRKRSRRKSVTDSSKLEFSDIEPETPKSTRSSLSPRNSKGNVEIPRLHLKRTSLTTSILNEGFRSSPSHVLSNERYKLSDTTDVDDSKRNDDSAGLTGSLQGLDEGFLQSASDATSSRLDPLPEYMSSPFVIVESFTPQPRQRNQDLEMINVATPDRDPMTAGSYYQSDDMLVDTPEPESQGIAVHETPMDMSIASDVGLTIPIPPETNYENPTAEPDKVILTPLSRQNGYDDFDEDAMEEELDEMARIVKPFIGIFLISNNTLLGGLKRRIKSLPSNPAEASLVLRLSRAAFVLRKSLLKKGKLIGKGSYGQVFLVRTNLSDKQYALKQVRIELPRNKTEADYKKYIEKQVNLLREKDTMLLLNHPFICQFKASWCERHPDKKISYFFLMEYAPFGSLAFFIILRLHKTMVSRVHNLTYPAIQEKILQHQMDIGKRNQPQGQKFRKLLFYIYSAEIASAISYLHGKGLVHRDLKPLNVLIGRDYHLRVTDFGFTNPCEAYHSYRFHRPWDKFIYRPNILNPIPEDDFKSGTVGYDYTPEMAKNQVFDTSRYPTMDVWALGVIMYEIYTGVNPFVVTIDPQSKEKCRLAVLEWESNILLNEPIFSSIIPDTFFRSLIRRTICLQRNRMSADEVFAALDNQLVKMTDQTLSQIASTPLSALSSIFGLEIQEPSSQFNQPWSPSTPTNVGVHHPLARIFPNLGASPIL